MKALVRGVVLALLTLGVAVLLPPEPRAILFAVILGAGAAVYVGFALVDGRRRAVRVEATAAVAFIAVAVLGAWLSRPLLAAGYVGHGVWDLTHHPRGIRTHVPREWPPLCLAYDLVVAAFLVTPWA